ncbi:hypothetical protein QZH56_02865 [Streptomyces olivoreticuli]|uniref:hypothetical protein n=1 Tax=Streptomyces olivoreticuli TaxID=68246 RepID=UPI0026591B78|nr:hypothetical protein [Streptomyces olivoreticuli]WKK24606.1 hypothetical protein QZH56_02865 [Streptomyces olivoreticuli]
MRFAINGSTSCARVGCPDPIELPPPLPVGRDEELVGNRQTVIGHVADDVVEGLERPDGAALVMAVPTGMEAGQPVRLQFRTAASRRLQSRVKTGATGTNALMITPNMAVPKKWPATATSSQAGNVPEAQSFDALARQSTSSFTHSMTVASGQGNRSKPDDLVSAVYEPQIRIAPAPGWGPTAPEPRSAMPEFLPEGNRKPPPAGAGHAPGSSLARITNRGGRCETRLGTAALA